MTEKKTNFMDAIKAAQINKSKVPLTKTAAVQQAKFKNQVNSNRPTKISVGRGG
jgi:hypothetical protein